MKRIPRFFTQKAVLLFCLIPFLFTGCGKGGTFTKTTHVFGRVTDRADGSGVPGCRLRFYKVWDEKGSTNYSELASAMSGKDGAFSFDFTTMGDNSFDCVIDSTPPGFETPEHYFNFMFVMDENLFKGKDEVTFNRTVISYAFLKLHLVGDGDSPKLRLDRSNEYFNHGSDVTIVKNVYALRSAALRYTMFDANNPDVEFTRYLTDVIPKHDTLMKEIHF